MKLLDDIVTNLDLTLKTASIADYPGAYNGLQLANSGKVNRIFAAVDASLSVIKAAAVGGPGLLIVHHGLFWQGVQPITKATYQKLKIAMDSDLAIYSSHLPLDAHEEHGNSLLLAKACGLSDLMPFFEYKNTAIGVRGQWSGSRDSMVSRLTEVLNGAVHLCPGGPETVKHVAIISGGAGGEVANVAAHGIDTFITGEGPHWSYPLAEEHDVNLLYAGHYATETFGVKSIAAKISTMSQIPWEFIHRPTGL